MKCDVFRRGFIRQNVVWRCGIERDVSASMSLSIYFQEVMLSVHETSCWQVRNNYRFVERTEWLVKLGLNHLVCWHYQHLIASLEDYTSATAFRKLGRFIRDQNFQLTSSSTTRTS